MMCDKNLLLVTTIEKHPCLYNSNLQDYMKKEITEKSWAEVANQMSLSVSECKEKWRNLRYSLLRSLKPNAYGAVKKRYYLHKEMEFLLPFIKSRGAMISQLDEEIDEENSHEQDMTSPQQQLYEYEFLNSEPVQKRKRNAEQLQNNEVLAPSEDSRRQFMLGLMPEIDALSEPQMKMFRRKILALLDDITEVTDFEAAASRIKPEPTESDIQSVTYVVRD